MDVIGLLTSWPSLRRYELYVKPIFGLPPSILDKNPLTDENHFFSLANGIACMRRRSDSWINATQILKVCFTITAATNCTAGGDNFYLGETADSLQVADFDKPQRTRILEREVQRGVHEKVQGGYGKYQGWLRLCCC